MAKSKRVEELINKAFNLCIPNCPTRRFHRVMPASRYILQVIRAEATSRGFTIVPAKHGGDGVYFVALVEKDGSIYADPENFNYISDGLSCQLSEMRTKLAHAVTASQWVANGLRSGRRKIFLEDFVFNGEITQKYLERTLKALRDGTNG